MSRRHEQNKALTAAQDELNLGPVALAAEMGAPYSTYRCWKNESRKMPPVAWRCLELVKLKRAAGGP